MKAQGLAGVACYTLGIYDRNIKFAINKPQAHPKLTLCIPKPFNIVRYNLYEDCRSYKKNKNKKDVEEYIDFFTLNCKVYIFILLVF